MKPANIVLNEFMQAKITDFGTAKKMTSSKSSQMSTTSDVSYISGLSHISAMSSNVEAHKTISKDMDRIPLEDKETDESLEELVGSEHYISPEMLESRQSSYSSDVWALGIMIYQFFTGKVPFKGKTQDETFELIKKGKFVMSKDIPEDAADLIKQILVKNPEQRLGADNLEDLMFHRFFDGVDFSLIGTQLPPMKVELDKTQKIMMKYLPKTQRLVRSNSNIPSNQKLLTMKKI